MHNVFFLFLKYNSQRDNHKTIYALKMVDQLYLICKFNDEKVGRTANQESIWKNWKVL